MIDLPEKDLSGYQNLFGTIYSKEKNREIIYTVLKNLRIEIEKIQNCKFEVLDNIYSKDVEGICAFLLNWLKFNFTELQEETEELNEYYRKSEEDIFNSYMAYYYCDYESPEVYQESFEAEKKEYERHKQLRKCKKEVLYNCKRLTRSNKAKNKFISEFKKALSFPEEYNKFGRVLPKMIEYKKETGKKVFYRGNISKQFLKWYNS